MLNSKVKRPTSRHYSTKWGAANELRKAAEKQLKKELEERLDDDEKRVLGGLKSLIGKDKDKDED